MKPSLRLTFDGGCALIATRLPCHHHVRGYGRREDAHDHHADERPAVKGCEVGVGRADARDDGEDDSGEDEKGGDLSDEMELPVERALVDCEREERSQL